MLNKFNLFLVLSFCLIQSFLAFTYCRFCLVIWFFIPATTANDPPTSKDFYPRFYPLHCNPILNLQEEPVVPFLMLIAKQGNYWYHFYNVFGMTRSLTGNWTRTRCQHSTTRLSRRWWRRCYIKWFSTRILWSVVPATNTFYLGFNWFLGRILRDITSSMIRFQYMTWLPLVYSFQFKFSMISFPMRKLDSLWLWEF